MGNLILKSLGSFLNRSFFASYSVRGQEVWNNQKVNKRKDVNQLVLERLQKPTWPVWWYNRFIATYTIESAPFDFKKPYFRLEVNITLTGNTNSKIMSESPILIINYLEMELNTVNNRSEVIYFNRIKITDITTFGELAPEVLKALKKMDNKDPKVLKAVKAWEFLARSSHGNF